MGIPQRVKRCILAYQQMALSLGRTTGIHNYRDTCLKSTSCCLTPTLALPTAVLLLTYVIRIIHTYHRDSTVVFPAKVRRACGKWSSIERGRDEKDQRSPEIGSGSKAGLALDAVVVTSSYCTTWGRMSSGLGLGVVDLLC
jgi:hypothetical protein